MTQKSIVTHRLAVGEKLVQAVRSMEERQLRKVQEKWELQHPDLRDAWHVRIHGEEQGPVEYGDINHALLEGYGPVEVLHADHEEEETAWTPVAYDPYWRKNYLSPVLTATLGIFVAIFLSIVVEALLPWPWENYASNLVWLAVLAWWLLPFASGFGGAKKTAAAAPVPEEKKKERSIDPVEKTDRLAA